MSSHYPRLLFTFLVLLAVSLAVLLAAPISADSHGEDRDSGSQGASDPEPSCPSCIEPPPAPTGFTVTPNGKTTFSVKWNSVSGATKYRLEYQNPGSQQWIRVSDYASGSTRTISGFDCDTAYTFRVRAFGDGDDYTATWGAASTRYATTHLCAPPEPTGFIAEASGKTSIRLNWDFQGGISRYSIDRRPSSTSSWTSVTSSASGSSRSYTVPNLTCNTAYLFRIRAYGDGYSYAAEWSPVNVSYNYVSTELCLAPAPRGFTVTANDDTSFNVRWTNVPGANSYLLEYLGPGGPRCPSCPDWVELGTYTSGYTRTIHGFSPGTRYDFRVRAYGDGVNLNSKLGDAATTSATIPLPVINSITGLSGYAAYQDGDTKIDLSWDPESGVSRYQVQYRLSTSSRWLTATSNLSGSSTSYTVTGLQCSKEYQFQIRAYGDGSSYASSWGPYTSSPHPSASTELCCATAPRNFTVTAIDDDESHSSFNVSWTTVPNADSYLVESMAPAGARCPSCPDWVSEGTFYSRGPHTISGFSPGTRYDFRVRAYGDGVNLNSKLGDAATTSATIPLPVINSITGLSGYAAYQDGDTKIDLSWDPESGVSRFQIQYRLSTSSRWLTATSNLSGSSTSYTVTGLQCGKEYQFQIRAYGDGSSYASSWGPYSSSPHPSASTELCCATAPRNFTVTANDDDESHSSFNVSWSEVANADSYLLESMAPAGARCPSCPDWVSEGTFYSRGPHTISGFSPGTTYQFRVRAYGDGVNLNSKLGDAATTSATIPRPVINSITGLSGYAAYQDGDTKIDLSWNPESGVSRYQVQYRLSTSSRWLTATSNLSGSSTSYTVTGLQCSKEYQFQIRAHGDGSSYASSWGPYTSSPYPSASTDLCLPPAPSGFNVTPNDDTSFNVSWTNMSGVTSYLLEYLGPAGPRCPSCPDWVELGSYSSGGAHTISGFSPGTTYQFRVRAYGDAVTYRADYGDAATRSATTHLVAPPAPDGFTATAASDSQVDLSWDPQDGIARYQIQHRLSTSSWTTLTSTLPGTNSSYTTSNLSPDTDYEFRVRAYGDAVGYIAQWSPYSHDSATTHEVLDTPPAPDGFTATAVSDSQIDLSWHYRSGISNYQVQYRLSTSSSWSNSTTEATGSSTSYTVTGLQCSKEYQFQIRAHGDGSSYASSWGPYTSSPYPSASTDLCLPPAPSGFNVTPNDDTSFNVSWTNMSGVTSYLLEYLGPAGPRCPSCPDWVELGSYSSGGAHTISGFSPGTTYQFRVRAYGDAVTYRADYGDAATRSATTHLVAPPAPDGFTATAASDSQIDLSWDPQDGIARYQIQHRLSTSSWTTLTSTLPGTNSSYTTSNLSPDTDYEFRVRAYGDAVGYIAQWSPYSHDSATTHEVLDTPPTPTGLTATPDGNSVDLAWDHLSGISTYGIEQLLSTSSSWILVTNTATGTSYRVTNLFFDTEYEFRIQALGDGVSFAATWSEWTSPVRSTTGGSPLTPPPVPSGLRASSVECTSATITWTPMSGVISYDWRITEDSIETRDPSDPDGPSTQAEYNNLLPGTIYNFQVRAYGDGELNSAAYSDYAYLTFTTTSASQCSEPLTPPTVPSGLTTSSVECTSATITWTPMSGVSSYDWRINEDGIETRDPSAPDGPSTRAELDNLLPGTRYTFQVRAYGDGELNSAAYSDFAYLTFTTTTTSCPTAPLTIAACSTSEVVPSTEVNRFLVRECEILVTIHTALTGGAEDALDWSGSVEIFEWEGLSFGEVGQHQRVVGLHLGNKGLMGRLTSEFVDLTALRGIFLNDNQLEGSLQADMIPASLYTLDLSNNRLKGTIPGDISGASLTLLDLSNNRLSGRIPAVVGNLTSLSFLYLDNNGFTGSPPDELGNLTHAQVVHLNNNRLSGQIPSSLALMSQTVQLHLRGNNWSGCAPRHVWALPFTDRELGWGVTQCLDDPEEALASFHPRCPLASHIDPSSSQPASRTITTSDGELHTLTADIYRGVAIWENLYFTLSNLFTNISPQRPTAYCVFGLVGNNSSRESSHRVQADMYFQTDISSGLLQLDRNASGFRECSDTLECRYNTPTLVSPPQYNNWLNELLGIGIQEPAFWLYGLHEVTSTGDTRSFLGTRGYNVSTLLWETLIPTPRTVGVSRHAARQTEIDIAWTLRSGATRYRVDRSNTGRPGSAYWDTISDNVTSVPFTDRDLECGRGYHYVVYSRGDGSTWRNIWGAPSIRVILHTEPCEDEGGNNDPAPLDRPRQLTARITGPGTASLDWADVAGATSYRLRVLGYSGWQMLPHGSISVSFNGSSATIAGLDSFSRSFRFGVKAVNDATESRWASAWTVNREREN